MQTKSRAICRLLEICSREVSLEQWKRPGCCEGGVNGREEVVPGYSDHSSKQPTGEEEVREEASARCRTVSVSLSLYDLSIILKGKMERRQCVSRLRGMPIEMERLMVPGRGRNCRKRYQRRKLS